MSEGHQFGHNNILHLQIAISFEVCGFLIMALAKERITQLIGCIILIEI